MPESGRSRAVRLTWSGGLRGAAAGLALLVLLLFALLGGQLPWLGQFEWIDGIQPESGLAWIAPLSSPALDEDGHALDVALLEYRPGPAAWLCRLAGPAFARTPDGFCADSWHLLGPAHQIHDAIRHEGGGRFSVWHGQLYFSDPTGGDPRTPGRRFALWLPWSGAASWAAGLAGICGLWAVWPVVTALVRALSATGMDARRHARLLLGLLGLGACGVAATRGPAIGTLAWAGLLLAALHLLPAGSCLVRCRGWIGAAVLALGGFAATEAGLSFAYARLGLVADLPITRLVKYLADTETDRPILLLVGSSYSQYGIDETALETALAAAGHKMTVLRLGFGGLSIPERLYYVRRYLATARHRPVAVLFEISAYYDTQPLKQLEQNLFSRREIAAMDTDNFRLSLHWALGPDGDPAKRIALTAELLGHVALHYLQAGFLPQSAPVARLPANGYRGAPAKLEQFTDAQIAEDLRDGQQGEILPPDLLWPGAPTAIPSDWTRQAIVEAIGLFRTAGVTRFGFYAVPSRYIDEPIYARQFCRAMVDYPCLPSQDPELLAALAHDVDWLDETHLQGPGRQLYTEWLAARLSAAAVLP